MMIITIIIIYKTESFHLNNGEHGLWNVGFLLHIRTPEYFIDNNPLLKHSVKWFKQFIIRD